VGVYRIMLVTSLIGVVAAQAWGEQAVGYGTRSGIWSRLKPQNNSGRQPPL
jgi:hypothetical protein